MPKEIILDLGVGRGGKYIRNRADPRAIRIGVDKNLQALREARKVYGLEVVQADLSHSLPIAVNSVSRVETIFPDQELVENLGLRREGLQEIHDILIPGGIVEVTVEYPFGGRYRIFTDKEGDSGPMHELIIDQSRREKFVVQNQNQSPRQIAELGTEYGTKFTDLQANDGHLSFHKITATKK